MIICGNVMISILESQLGGCMVAYFVFAWIIFCTYEVMQFVK